MRKFIQQRRSTHKDYDCPGNGSGALESKNQSQTMIEIWRYQREVVEADNCHT